MGIRTVKIDIIKYLNDKGIDFETLKTIVEKFLKENEDTESSSSDEGMGMDYLDSDSF